MKFYVGKELYGSPSHKRYVVDEYDSRSGEFHAVSDDDSWIRSNKCEVSEDNVVCENRRMKQ